MTDNGPHRNSSPLRLGVIGAGQRAMTYLEDLPPEIASRVDLVAVCEPSDTAYNIAAAGFPSSKPRRYDDPYALMAEAALNALIIATPNHLHAALGTAAITAGIPTLLEKPVALTPHDAGQLWAAHLASPEIPVTVGFPLRHTPFYRRVHDLIESGKLGQILTIDAHELLDTPLTKVFHEGWRSDAALSGGFLVEKCCHDMDVLMWLAGGSPRTVFSLAGRDHFRPRPDSEQERRFQPTSAVAAALDFGHRRTLSEPASRTDPYATPAGNVDHQSVLVGFDNGVIVTFSTAMAQPVTTRRVVVLGSRGEIQGDLKTGTIVCRFADDDGGFTEVAERITAPSSGHHGGDRGISQAFWATVTGDMPANGDSLRGGLQAALLAWTAQESASTEGAVAADRVLSRLGLAASDNGVDAGYPFP